MIETSRAEINTSAHWQRGDNGQTGTASPVHLLGNSDTVSTNHLVSPEGWSDRFLLKRVNLLYKPFHLQADLQWEPLTSNHLVRTGAIISCHNQNLFLLWSRVCLLVTDVAVLVISFPGNRICVSAGQVLYKTCIFLGELALLVSITIPWLSFEEPHHSLYSLPEALQSFGDTASSMFHIVDHININDDNNTLVFNLCPTWRGCFEWLLWLYLIYYLW